MGSNFGLSMARKVAACRSEAVRSLVPKKCPVCT